MHLTHEVDILSMDDLRGDHRQDGRCLPGPDFQLTMHLAPSTLVTPKYLTAVDTG